MMKSFKIDQVKEVMAKISLTEVQRRKVIEELDRMLEPQFESDSIYLVVDSEERMTGFIFPKDMPSSKAREIMDKHHPTPAPS